MSEKEREAMREPEDSLFSHEQLHDDYDATPWWQRNFLISRPVLFGTWDGVFTTVLVNIFGVIVFLRMGWIVGTAGIANAVLLLIICASLALVSVFSAIGICERCQIQSGGIYFLVSHVLGGQIGGAVGLMYAFGQSVATGLVVIGFGESVARFFGTESTLLDKFIAITTLLVLAVINMAGIRWVIGLQLILLAFLAIAVVDFYFGSIFSIDLNHGVGYFSLERFDLNTNPMYDEFNCSQFGFDGQQASQNFFTVFGVFFANFLGVLAGYFKFPSLCELSAIGISSVITLSFILLLGSLVDRTYLICDSMIAEKVAFTGFLFLTGLYVSSLSSTVGTLLGTPRVIQNIASEGIIPILNPLSVGYGPNKNPLRASMVMIIIAIVFVLLGDLNHLAILSTMPFLITYAFVNYSYVSLAMSYDLQTVTKVSASTKTLTYGSIENFKSAKRSQESGDLENLFPERHNFNLDVAIFKHELLITLKVLGEKPSSIIDRPITWYSSLSNRYISLVGAITNISIIFFVNLWYAVLHLLALIALYCYIGRVCPSAFPGISQFSLPHMFRTAFSRSSGSTSVAHMVISHGSESNPELQVSVTELNEENPDYADRKRYHHSKYSGSASDIADVHVQ
ncbi:unnamed protein product [Thelazia callipaeda]|uniref:Solute carrier family 12 member 8 n=1 Tax=Thelazia callipaeda TaxID=103827 RepID=A0A158RD25_THECL|nr:unnamed protein product [Thelazia callipaeda]